MSAPTTKPASVADAIRSVINSHFCGIEPATTSSGCYTNDVSERVLRAALPRAEALEALAAALPEIQAAFAAASYVADFDKANARLTAALARLK